MRLKILLIIISLNPVLGFSQSTQNTFSNISEEVIVTARKREEGSQSVPISISAFSGETLEEVGIFTYEDLDRVSPNLQVVKNGAYGTSAVTIRGVGGSGFSVTSESQAATYIDGIYVSRTQGNFLDLWDLNSSKRASRNFIWKKLNCWSRFFFLQQAKSGRRKF